MTKGPDLASRRLEGRRVLLTGAASGIGRAAAERLAAEGALVVITDRHGDECQRAVSEIQSWGGTAIAGTADVSDERSLAHAVGAAADAAGGLDGLVTCAGIVHATPTIETSLAIWELTLRINLTGTFLAVRECLPHMLATGGGSIVTVGSVASSVAGGYTSSYDASKGAVLQFTRAIAAEHADRGIRANCVLPGAVSTNLKRTSAELVDPSAGRPRQWTQAPIGRHAQPSEIAAAIAFLISDDASFMTGAGVAVDGGFTAV